MQAYVKAKDVEAVKRRIIAAALSLGCEYDEKNVGGGRVGLLSTLNGEGYPVYHCVVNVQPDGEGYKVELIGIPEDRRLQRQMELRQREKERFLREVER